MANLNFNSQYISLSKRVNADSAVDIELDDSNFVNGALTHVSFGKDVLFIGKRRDTNKKYICKVNADTDSETCSQELPITFKGFFGVVENKALFVGLDGDAEKLYLLNQADLSFDVIVRANYTYLSYMNAIGSIYFVAKDNAENDYDLLRYPGETPTTFRLLQESSQPILLSYSSFFAANATHIFDLENDKEYEFKVEPDNARCDFICTVLIRGNKMLLFNGLKTVKLMDVDERLQYTSHRAGKDYYFIGKNETAQKLYFANLEADIPSYASEITGIRPKKLFGQTYTFVNTIENNVYQLNDGSLGEQILSSATVLDTIYRTVIYAKDKKVLAYHLDNQESTTIIDSTAEEQIDSVDTMPLVNAKEHILFIDTAKNGTVSSGSYHITIRNVCDAKDKCNGHGACYDNKCTCFSDKENGFFSGVACEKCASPNLDPSSSCKVCLPGTGEAPSCSNIVCYGISSNNSQVCGGHGICSGYNTCTCNKRYAGANCTITSCYGYWANDERACSRNGACIDFNTCSCVEGFSGYDCREWKQEDYLWILIILMSFGSGILVVIILASIACIFRSGFGTAFRQKRQVLEMDDSLTIPKEAPKKAGSNWVQLHDDNEDDEIVGLDEVQSN